MNQAQEMLHNMLVMTCNDVKQMHGLSHDEVTAVLTAVAEDPLLTGDNATGGQPTPVPQVQPADVVEPEPVPSDGKTVNITDVDNVVIETTEEVETKPAPKKRAAKKTTTKSE